MKDNSNTDWMPIESAPRDGTRILVWTDTNNDVDRQYVEDVCEGEHFAMAQIAFWDASRCGGQAWWDKERIGEPLYWMPLPTPPKGPAND